jgi:hypothetical protein
MHRPTIVPLLVLQKKPLEESLEPDRELVIS